MRESGRIKYLCLLYSLMRLEILNLQGGRAGERGAGGTKYWGPSRGPALIKFFFRDTQEEMLEKLRLGCVKTYVHCAK